MNKKTCFHVSFLIVSLWYFWGFPPSLVKHLLAMQETPVWFLGWEDTLERDRLSTPVFLGFPGGSDSKESPAMWETWVRSLGWEDLLEDEEAWQSTLVFLSGESRGQRSLVGYSPCGQKESDTTEWLSTAQHMILQV